MKEICYTCESLSGKRQISPGDVIYEAEYWTVEHCYPVAFKGWLVIVLKRHIEALHELTSEEFNELSQIQQKVVQILHRELSPEKEYMMCFAEGDHFHHIHFHVVAKPKDLPPNLKGPHIFALMNKPGINVIPEHEIQDFCSDLKAKFNNL